MIDTVCSECNGDLYELIGCCSGFECGCIGQPVGIRGCVKCNKDASKDIPKSILDSCEYADKLELHINK